MELVTPRTTGLRSSGTNLAAEQGEVESRKMQGLMYYKGVGVTVTQDCKTAFQWYKLVVEQEVVGADGETVTHHV